MIKFAYLNEESIVVQVIVGDLDEAAHDILLRDYGVLFNAVKCVRVDNDQSVWIGGRYDNETGFTPPPPELVEVIAESLTEGKTVNDDAPIE